jgi:hypothetical protein
VLAGEPEGDPSAGDVAVAFRSLVTDNLVILSTGVVPAGFAGNELNVPGYHNWFQGQNFPEWGLSKPGPLLDQDDQGAQVE